MDIDDRFVTKRKPSKTSTQQRSSSQLNININIPSVHSSHSIHSLNPKRRKVTTRKTTSSKANLVFPVARFKRYLHDGNYASKISPKSCVYLAAVLEYLSAEVIDIACDVARTLKRTRINPRHITLAIRNDESLNNLLSKTTISEGGVLPNIQPFLFEPKRSPKPKENSNKAKNNSNDSEGIQFNVTTSYLNEHSDAKSESSDE